jgi:hypothetical protein
VNRTTELAAALADRPELVVDADLDVSVDGHQLSVSGDGEVLTVSLDSLVQAVGLLRAAGGRYRVRELSRLVTAAGLTLVVTVGDSVVARVGRDAEPGSLGQPFGAQLSARGIVGAVVADLRRRLG